MQAHGTFANGVVFDITQGFVYGHLAKKQPHNCYLDAIGTKGVARMRHNFAEATVELYGVRNTICKTSAFNDKKLDVMVDVFGRSILAGKNLGFPQARDSVIASELSWAMLNDAISHTPSKMVCARLGSIDQTRFGQFRKSAADVLWNPPLAVNKSCAGKTGGEGAEPCGVSDEGAVLS